MNKKRTLQKPISNSPRFEVSLIPVQSCFKVLILVILNLLQSSKRKGKYVERVVHYLE